MQVEFKREFVLPGNVDNRGFKATVICFRFFIYQHGVAVIFILSVQRTAVLIHTPRIISAYGSYRPCFGGNVSLGKRFGEGECERRTQHNAEWGVSTLTSGRHGADVSLCVSLFGKPGSCHEIRGFFYAGSHVYYTAEKVCPVVVSQLFGIDESSVGSCFRRGIPRQ